MIDNMNLCDGTDVFEKCQSFSYKCETALRLPVSAFNYNKAKYPP